MTENTGFTVVFNGIDVPVKNRFDLYSTARPLWEEFGDVCGCDDDGVIDTEWMGFPAGTDREDVWHEFERAFGPTVEDPRGVIVYELMYPGYRAEWEKVTAFGRSREIAWTHHLEGDCDAWSFAFSFHSCLDYPDIWVNGVCRIEVDLADLDRELCELSVRSTEYASFEHMKTCLGDFEAARHYSLASYAYGVVRPTDIRHIDFDDPQVATEFIMEDSSEAIRRGLEGTRVQGFRI